MRARLSLLLVATVLPLALAVACGYSPKPANGELKCGSSDTCPEGYSCMSEHCWQNGAAGSGGSTGSAGRGGTTGTGGSSATDKFIGTWSFGIPSTRMIGCTDGYTESKEWSGLGEMFVISAGGSAALRTHYYCDWDLDVAAAGTSTMIRPNMTCSLTDNSQTPPVTYSWRGMLFTLSTTNGLTGTLTADIPYDYASTAGTGSCTMHFTGSMTKN
jgi:hypothetical protein